MSLAFFSLQAQLSSHRSCVPPSCYEEIWHCLEDERCLYTYETCNLLLLLVLMLSSKWICTEPTTFYTTIFVIKVTFTMRLTARLEVLVPHVYSQDVVPERRKSQNVVSLPSTHAVNTNKLRSLPREWHATHQVCLHSSVRPLCIKSYTRLTERMIWRCFQQETAKIVRPAFGLHVVAQRCSYVTSTLRNAALQHRSSHTVSAVPIVYHPVRQRASHQTQIFLKITSATRFLPLVSQAYSKPQLPPGHRFPMVSTHSGSNTKKSYLVVQVKALRPRWVAGCVQKSIRDIA